MKKFAQSTFVVLLFSAISIGIVWAGPIRQGTLSEMEPTEADYVMYVAKKEEQLALAHTPQEKKLALAEMPDAPFVSIRGKIIMPDGTPLPKDAPIFSVSVQSYRFTFSQSVSSDGTKRIDKNNTASASTGSSGSAQKDGTFQIDNAVRYGANVLLYVYCNHPTDNTYRQFLSKPIAFIAHPGMKPLEITLQKGIPVRGKITYPNGSPVTDGGLSFAQQIEPILGADIPELQNSFETSRWVNADSEGNYEAHLLPSEYTVSHDQIAQTLMIAESDREKKLDLTKPMPIFVEIKKQDGLLAGEIQYVIIDDENIGTSSSSARTGAFAIPPITNNRWLHVVDGKHEQGTLEVLTPEMIGKTMQFTLKPTSKVAIKLVDTNGNPLVNKKVVLFVYTEKQRARSSVGVEEVQTDSEGRAVLRVAPGKFAVTLQLPGSFMKPTFEGGISGTLVSREIDKALNLAPGEILDVGTVRLTLP